MLRFFDRYLYFFFRRHFHGLRLAGTWPRTHGPLLVCLNHPSWWDPLTCILLSRFVERQSDHYAPMDALAIKRYGIFEKLGLFPVEQGTARGAVQFLRAGSYILSNPRSVLWLTPQGGFTDVRTRPVVFRDGMDALLRKVEEVTVLPLAIEYCFWDERLPEALALFGEPMRFVQGQSQNASRKSEDRMDPASAALRPGDQVAAALTRTQDALAVLASQRNPSLFTPVLDGGAGTGGVYGLWQRLRALACGERFVAEHTSLHSVEPRRPERKSRFAGASDGVRNGGHARHADD